MVSCHYRLYAKLRGHCNLHDHKFERHVIFLKTAIAAIVDDAVWRSRPDKAVCANEPMNKRVRGCAQPSLMQPVA